MANRKWRGQKPRLPKRAHEGGVAVYELDTGEQEFVAARCEADAVTDYWDRVGRGWKHWNGIGWAEAVPTVTRISRLDEVRVADEDERDQPGQTLRELIRTCEEFPAVLASTV